MEFDEISSSLRLYDCRAICCIVVYCALYTNIERRAVNQIAKFMLVLIYLSNRCWYYYLYKQTQHRNAVTRKTHANRTMNIHIRPHKHCSDAEASHSLDIFMIQRVSE